MNTTDAKALLLRFNPIYPFDLFLGMKLPRLYIETIQSLLDRGYAYPSSSRPPEMTADDRLAVSHVVEQYAFDSPDYEPIDINPSRMQTYEAGLIAALLRNPPADQPSTGGGTYTKADLDAAEERGYARCRADGLKAIGGLHS